MRRAGGFLRDVIRVVFLKYREEVQSPQGLKP